MDDQQRRRHDRREFIRARHPDLGGDPDAFTAGLAELDLKKVAVPSARVVLDTDRPLLPGLLKRVARRISRRRPPARVK